MVALMRQMFDDADGNYGVPAHVNGAAPGRRWS